MADDTTPAIPEVPENLDDLTGEQLSTLHTDLGAANTALNEALASGTEAGSLTIGKRRELVAQIRSTVEAANRVADAIVSDTTVESDLSTLPEIQALPEPEAAVEVTDPAEPEVNAPLGDPAPAVAGLTADEIAAQRDDTGTGPVSQTEPDARPRVASLTAPESSRIFEPGADLSLADIGGAVSELALGRSYEGKVRVASLPSFEAHAELRESMLSKGNSAERNSEIMREAQTEWLTRFSASRELAGADARTAAICDPLDNIRDIPQAAHAREPFSDSLPSRPAGRLGFNFVPGLGLTDLNAGVAVWGETDQASVDPDDPDTWKPVIDIGCPTPSEVKAEAITAAFRADNTLDMSNPERVRDAITVINALRARVKTGRLLQLVDTFSHHFDYVAPYGGLVGVVQAVLSALPQGQFPNRLDDGTPYVLYLEPGQLELLTIDAVNKAYTTADDRRDVAAFIEDACKSAGWNVAVIDLDDMARADAAPFSALPAVGVAHRTPLPGLGGTAKMRLLAPEGFIYASTGSIEYGIERSPELHRQNKFQWFAEEYVMLAKNSPFPSYTIHATLCPNGARAGLATPFVCSADSPS